MLSLSAPGEGSPGCEEPSYTRLLEPLTLYLHLPFSPLPLSHLVASLWNAEPLKPQIQEFRAQTGFLPHGLPLQMIPASSFIHPLQILLYLVTSS